MVTLHHIFPTVIQCTCSSFFNWNFRVENSVQTLTLDPTPDNVDVVMVALQFRIRKVLSEQKQKHPFKKINNQNRLELQAIVSVYYLTLIIDFYEIFGLSSYFVCFITFLFVFRHFCLFYFITFGFVL